MYHAMKKVEIPMPEPRAVRITDRHKAMHPGERVSGTPEEMACVRAFWRKQGKQTVQQTVDGTVHVWRVS